MIILQLSDLRQLWVYNCYIWSIMILQLSDLPNYTILHNCHTCANYNFTIVILAPIVILQLSYLRQLWFYNCHTCAIMILQLSDLHQLYFTIVRLAPIIILQLSDFGQLFLYSCHSCANYDFTMAYCCQIWAYNLQLSDLRQLWVYNCFIWSNYDFTIVRLGPIIILQLSHLCQL